MMKRTYGIQSLILLMLVAPACLFAREGWRLEADPAPWAGRNDHNVETFNNRLWVFNGSFGATPPPHPFAPDIWSSVDGKNWIHEGPTPWGQRAGAASFVFNGKMWMLGGRGFFIWNDVWSTDDGVNWTLETSAAQWEERWGHTVAVFDGRMWVLGGYYKSGSVERIYNDVWSSTDGVNWTEETASAPWSPRFDHATVAFDSRLWVIAGGQGGGLLNDAWSSLDGINWVQATSAAPWDVRTSHNAQIYNGCIWILAGR